MSIYPPNTPTLPLSDATCDVIAKAMRAQNISPEKLAKQTGLAISTILQALDEHGKLPSKDELKAIAQPLQLSSDALAELSLYSPSVPTSSVPEELTQIVSPFYHVGANSYLIRHPNTRTATLFDTGTDASLIHEFIKQENLTLSAIYITHRHHDHTAGLDTFGNTPIFFADDFTHGQTVKLANSLTLTAVESSGHFTPSRAYVIDGLSINRHPTPLCICGDIIFPGSMGKTPSPEKHEESLQNAINYLMSLPPHTLLCSGHGPITTIALETESNPFFRD